jgi:hypothetical protein
MAGAGYRTFASGEVLTANNVQTYLMDQAVQVYAGTAARASAVPSPSAGMVAYSTATGLQVFDGSAWVNVGGVGYGEATGGQSTATITVGGESYTLLTFTSSSTLTVTSAGLFDVLVVGGGGGGGRRVEENIGAGGGGAGGIIQQTIYLDANATVTVGAGGATQSSTNARGKTGSFSRVNQVCAGGGGGGQMGDWESTSAGSAGGNCDNGGTFGLQVCNITVGGNNGGQGGFTAGQAAGGGGGGSTSVGANSSGSTAGNGGTGTDASTFKAGATLYVAAGGGGQSQSGTAGTAGNSTGGNGATGANAGSNANAANYGSGGGSGRTSGGSGSNGVCYVRFKV